MSTLPFTSEEDWESLEVDATDTRRYHARAILELRSRIEALEAARSAPDQQAVALLTRLPWTHPIAIELRRRFRGESQPVPVSSARPLKP
jgi:hypothetical protein